MVCSVIFQGQGHCMSLVTTGCKGFLTKPKLLGYSKLVTVTHLVG